MVLGIRGHCQPILFLPVVCLSVQFWCRESDPHYMLSSSLILIVPAIMLSPPVKHRALSLYIMSLSREGSYTPNWHKNKQKYRDILKLNNMIPVTRIIWMMLSVFRISIVYYSFIFLCMRVLTYQKNHYTVNCCLLGSQKKAHHDIRDHIISVKSHKSNKDAAPNITQRLLQILS